MSGPTRKEFEQAQLEFDDQLKRLDLRNVVVVDEDALAVPVDQLRELGAEFADHAFEREGLLPEDRSSWARDVFENLDIERRQELHRAWCETLRTAAIARDSGRALDVLTFLAGSRYRPMLPEEWEASVDSHGDFADHDLVLFDQDLRGFDRDGTDLLADFRDRFPHAKAALLTTTIDYEDHRPPNFAQFGPQTLVASKQRLTDAPLEFVDDVRLARAVVELDEARSVLLTVAREAHEHAVGYIAGDAGPEALDYRTLEELMVHVASEDGIWEGDALLRVLDIVYRAKIRDKLLGASGAPAQTLPGLLDKIRDVYSDRPARSANGYDKARELVQMESYERGRLINEAGLPLACGDIFEVDAPAFDGQSLWLLVDQPCDLQIRKDGSRGATDGTELVAIHTATAKRDGRQIKLRGVGERDYALDGFSRVIAADDHTKVPLARLSSRLFVPYDVLELCVFDRQGRCRIDVSLEVPDPVPQTPGLRARYDALRAQYAALVTDTADLGPKLQEQVLARGRIPGKLETECVFAWPVRRVERLREARAQAALQALANDRARPSFDRDLAEPAP